MHVLIIEDNVMITAQIADEFRRRGFIVECASTCDEAIAVAARKCPDLITADHWLSGESGISAVRKICENRPIPVIYVVALPEGVLEEEPEAVVLQKPFTSRGLSEAIAKAMPAPSRSPSGNEAPTQEGG